MKIKYIAIFLVLLCCFMGAASAAEDISTDLSDSLDSVDDSVAAEAVSEDASESVQTEHITDSSDDTTEEQIINETNDVEQTDDSANVESQTRATSATVTDWSGLNTYCGKNSPQTIYLSGAISASSQIEIKNSATIIGNPGSYITGGTNGVTYFTNTGDLSITFINVTKLTGDNEPVYVDITNLDDYDDIWDAIYAGIQQANNGGTLYLSEGTYADAPFDNAKDIVIIGLDKDKVIITNSQWSSQMRVGKHQSEIPGEPTFVTLVNMTFIGAPIELSDNLLFINCTFKNLSLNSQKYNAGTFKTTFEYIPENSYNINFTDCDFLDSSVDGSFFESFKYGQVNFKSCIFENIAANSLVNNSEGFTLNDGIFFSDCTFNNVNVKGIVDVPTGTIIGTEDDSRVRIEGCTGVESSGVVTEGGRDFINTTQSRLDTVLACDIDSENNFVVTLKDSEGNPVSGPISITINDGEVIPYDVDDGAFTIPFDELIGDLTGKVTIKAIFADTDSLVGSSDELSTLVVVKTETVEVPVAINPAATTIDANALTATAKVAKTLSVTLKDANGKAIANKTITYSINGVTKTAKTDANGIVKIAVNQAKAGTYYYSICFLGDNDYKSAFKTVKVTVNKQATKAVFKAKTFKVKATKKVSFTLKDASGKAIKGKKITFKVGKKTYTAKTNAKGVATVKVKLTKKGKYTVTAKFAGDSTYKAITKKAKITVK